MSLEPLRRFVRRFIRYDGAPYRLAAALLTRLEILRHEGRRTARDLGRLSHRGPDGPPQPIKLRGLEHPIVLRPGTDDARIIIDTVVRKEYGRWRPPGQPRVMVDAGAFIGDSSAWFLSNYPELRVIALEPEPANRELAIANLAPYGDRATVLPFALGWKEGTAHFNGDSSGGKMADDGIAIRVVTIPTLLVDVPEGRIDILKMDIEGAELQVLGTGARDWLSAVGFVVAELHGSAIEAAVCDVMHLNGFGARRFRSLSFFSRDYSH